MSKVPLPATAQANKLLRPSPCLPAKVMKAGETRALAGTGTFRVKTGGSRRLRGV